MHGLEHISHVDVVVGNIALYAAAVSLIVKEVLFQVTRIVAKKERSEVR